MGERDEKHPKQRSRLKKAVSLVSFGLLGWAVTQELRQPKDQRTWQGTLGGFIPYDLRVATPARMREAFWNPDDPRVFTPRPMGVGWAVNVGRMVRQVTSRA